MIDTAKSFFPPQFLYNVLASDSLCVTFFVVTTKVLCFERKAFLHGKLTKKKLLTGQNRSKIKTDSEKSKLWSISKANWDTECNTGIQTCKHNT